MNPHSKYFGLSQTFNNDREHTRSYSKNDGCPVTYSEGYGHATPSNGFTDKRTTSITF